MQAELGRAADDHVPKRVTRIATHIAVLHPDPLGPIRKQTPNLQPRPNRKLPGTMQPRPVRREHRPLSADLKPDRKTDRTGQRVPGQRINRA